MPTRPYQTYIRRAPPEGTPTREERAEAADRLMRLHSNEELSALVTLYKDKGPVRTLGTNPES